MDLIHPVSRTDVAEALRGASADGTTVLVVGGRQHMDRGDPCEADAELWTTQMDQVVAYDPAEMIAVVQAGMRVHDLGELLAGNGQEWAVDAPPEATVGGVIAAGVSSPRRLRVGHVRDTVVELELVTGDGRFVRSGARTVKNVTGYDIHRLATGSLGTLGVIVQAALKVRPLAQTGVTLFAKVQNRGQGGVSVGLRLLEAIPMAAGIVATATTVEIRLEGWDEEVRELTQIAQACAPELQPLGGSTGFPSDPPLLDPAPAMVVEAALPPSRIGALVEGLKDWTALVGVGLVWFRLLDEDPSDAVLEVQRRAAALGGMAAVVRGSHASAGAPLPAPLIHRRLKDSFDPAGILGPGRLAL